MHPNKIGPSTLAPTPINLKAMTPFLLSYPNRADGTLLEKGFRDGFSLGFEGERVPINARNLLSARQHPDILLSKIHKEIGLGRIAGPFQNPPFRNFRVSPVGLVPKSTPGEFRLIQHLSAPRGASVNDNIPPEQCSVTYTSFDKAVEMVATVGKSAQLAKADIQSAFRLLPVRPGDFELLGMCVNGHYYYDRCLPMGCSISCAHFERFSTFLEYCCRKISGSCRILHYLDDFFFVGESRADCESILRHFLAICERFGVPIAQEKTMGPTQVITFLGLEIDAAAHRVKVPTDKCKGLIAQLTHALAQPKLSLRQLQSLIGGLNFVCKAVSPGRAFLRRLIDLTRGVTRPHYKVRISAGAKEDIRAWISFLQHFNGSVMFLESELRDNEYFQFYTDSAGSIGFGVYFGGKWVQGKWPSFVLERAYSIAFLELFPIVVGLTIWGPVLANRKVLFWSDNQTVVHVVNNQTSKCPKIMTLVRRMVTVCLVHNIRFTAKHVPGVRNELADSLSRFQMEKFFRLAPDADPLGHPLPDHLWNSL